MQRVLCVCYHHQAWGAAYSGILWLMNTLTKVWMRWERGVRLSGPAHYLNDGASAGVALQSRWDEQLTWMTEWRRVTAGCPLRLRCWESCDRCHRCCPKCAPGRPPWTPVLTWSALSPPLWSKKNTQTQRGFWIFWSSQHILLWPKALCVAVQLISTD